MNYCFILKLLFSTLKLLALNRPQQLDRLVKVGVVVPASLRIKSEFLDGEFGHYVSLTLI